MSPSDIAKVFIAGRRETRNYNTMTWCLDTPTIYWSPAHAYALEKMTWTRSVNSNDDHFFRCSQLLSLWMPARRRRLTGRHFCHPINMSKYACGRTHTHKHMHISNMTALLLFLSFLFITYLSRNVCHWMFVVGSLLNGYKIFLFPPSVALKVYRWFY